MWPTEKEEDVIVFEPVSLCRDRESHTETQVKSDFTTKDLDRVARLSKKDEQSLRDGDPTPHAIDMIQQRIEAARSLKYPWKENAD